MFFQLLRLVFQLSVYLASIGANTLDDHAYLSQGINYCYDDVVDIHPRINQIKEDWKACFFMIPLRDDFLDIYVPRESDQHFEQFYNLTIFPSVNHSANIQADLRMISSFGFYNFEKYNHLPTDVLFFFVPTDVDYMSEVIDGRTFEDLVSHYLMKYFVAVEYGYYYNFKFCIDRDSDFVPSFPDSTGCMFALMNRTYSVGPIAFNSFYVDYVEQQNDSYRGFEHLHDTFLKVQAEQRGCQTVNLVMQQSELIIKNNYLQEGQCTGSLNLTSFDLLCCCYEDPYKCMYSAPFIRPGYDWDFQMKRMNEVIDPRISDDMFLCINAVLNSSNPANKFYGVSRDKFLTELSKMCYLKVTAVVSKDFKTAKLIYEFGSSNGSDVHCDNSRVSGKSKTTTTRVFNPSDHAVYNYSLATGAELMFCCVGHLCNHYGIYYPDKYPEVFKWGFEITIPKRMSIGCGFFPVYLQELLTKYRDLRSCYYSIDLRNQGEIFLDPYSFAKVNASYVPMNHTIKDATFPCYYYERENNMTSTAGVEKKSMHFGCAFPLSFIQEFEGNENYTALNNVHFVRLLREEYIKHQGMSRCLYTKSKAIDLFTFMRLESFEYSRMLINIPICYALLYSDSPFAQVIAGPCSDNMTLEFSKKCCEFGDDMSSSVGLGPKNGVNTKMPTWYASKTFKMYDCKDDSCLGTSMNIKCFVSYGLPAEGDMFVEFLLSNKPRGVTYSGDAKKLKEKKKLVPSLFFDEEAEEEKTKENDDQILISTRYCESDKTASNCLDGNVDQNMTPLSCVVTHDTANKSDHCAGYGDKLAEYRNYFLCFILPRINDHDYYREAIVYANNTPMIYRCSVKLPSATMDEN